MILALKALSSSFVLWRTQRWELMADMILQKNQQEFLPKIIQKNILVSVIKIWQYNSSNKDFCKNKNREYHN